MGLRRLIARIKNLAGPKGVVQVLEVKTDCPWCAEGHGFYGWAKGQLHVLPGGNAADCYNSPRRKK
jgi:hypothetical protein